MLNLDVTVDNNSGFCFGVVYAIELAEEYLDEYGKLYSLGDIVHNDEEVKRLQEKGLQTIDHDQLKELKNERVLIRAHGEPPETYQIGMENDLELIDASCPVVLKLQHRVKNAYKQKEKPIYIYGKQGHPEIKALMGQTSQDSVVFSSEEELEQMELPEELQLFSQTTKDISKLYGIRDKLEARGINVDLHDTICRQVSNRDGELRDFVLNFDKIVFVSGTKSSNGKVLYEVCKTFNPNSYFVSSVEEVNPNWFEENNSVGICGATSTPQWLMNNIRDYLETL